MPPQRGMFPHFCQKVMWFRALRVLGVLYLYFHHLEVFFEEGMKE